ncbi:MAG TPA: hypothetical protein VGB74_03890 [Actinoplanes sp.]
MAGVVAAAVGITAVAAHIDRSSDVYLADRTGIAVRDMPVRLPTLDFYSNALEPTSPAWTPTPNTSQAARVPVGGVLPPHGSVTMLGDSGEEMELSVVRIANPALPIDPENPSKPALNPRPGYRLITITMLVKNTGDVPFMTDIEKHTWLVDKAGNTFSRNIEMTEARQLVAASQLEPNWWSGREIVFEVKGGAEPTRFRLSTHPGVANQTADWRLS